MKTRKNRNDKKEKSPFVRVFRRHVTERSPLFIIRKAKKEKNA